MKSDTEWEVDAGAEETRLKYYIEWKKKGVIVFGTELYDPFIQINPKR
ncbi:hypothetical protein BH20BAC1_BH20BAC1_27320 [soil metagenome]